MKPGDMVVKQNPLEVGVLLWIGLVGGKEMVLVMFSDQDRDVLLYRDSIRPLHSLVVMLLPDAYLELRQQAWELIATGKEWNRWENIT
jgi:hypothetical protein